MNQTQEELGNTRPVVDDEATDDSGYTVREDPKPESFSFRYFRAMFLGGLIGSLLGTVLVKIITQFL